MGLSFHASFGSKVGHLFKGPDIFLAAVRIAAVVELVGAEEDIFGPEFFCQGESEREKDRVPSWHIGRRNALWNFLRASPLGHFDLIGQGGAADGSQIKIDDPMIFDSEKCRYLPCGFDFALVSLAVTEG